MGNEQRSSQMSENRYEFGDFVVDVRRVEVRRAGMAVDLEPKAFDVLRYLIENRDRLVPKDELLDVVWKDTFVTPNALSRAVAQLRKALGDDASEARYVETVVKRGYRFIAPLVEQPATETTTGIASSVPAPGRLLGAHASRRSVWLVMSSLAAATVIAVAALWLIPRTPSPVEGGSALSLRRLTVEPDSYGGPTISADGHAIAFASVRNGTAEIHSASFLPGGRDTQITTDGGGNVQPAFSPDRQWLAYHSRKRGGIWVVPAGGGTSRQIAEFGSQPSWSSDSTRIVFTSDAGGLSSQAVLWSVERDGGAPAQLTQLGNPPGGHLAPSWSRDGRLIVFNVGGQYRREIWVIDSGGRQAHRIATGATAAPPRFSPDDEAVYWIGRTSDGNECLMRATLDGNGELVGTPETISPFPGHSVGGFSIAVDGTSVISLNRTTSNLFAIDLGDGLAARDPIQLTRDDAQNLFPEYGPTGRIAYQQEAAGRAISSWVMDDDGGNKEALAVQPSATVRMPQWGPDGKRAMALVDDTAPSRPYLAWIDLTTRRTTRLARHQAAGPPNLAPDGQQIAFHVIGSDGVMNVWIQRIDDGSMRQITFDREAVTFPRWSADGQWLAVTIKRGDRTHAGIIPALGGELTQLTSDRGQSWPYSFSPDNEYIAFGGEREGVWNIYVVSRKTKRVTQLTHFTTDNGHARFPAWSRRGHRIVFVRGEWTASLWSVKLP